jgi:hypothetical protein
MKTEPASSAARQAKDSNATLVDLSHEAPPKPFKELSEAEKQAVLQEALTRDQCVAHHFGFFLLSYRILFTFLVHND